METLISTEVVGTTNQFEVTKTSIPVTRKRQTRIKASSTSFRLGKKAEPDLHDPKVKHREFHFIIPSAAVLGNDIEATKVLRISETLSATAIGTVVQVSIGQGTWKIHFRLPIPTEDVEDDYYLSDVSKQLQEVINTLPDLRTGFAPGKGGRWEFFIGDFLAEDGEF